MLEAGIIANCECVDWARSLRSLYDCAPAGHHVGVTSVTYRTATAWARTYRSKLRLGNHALWIT
jgi:hypothetical protein